MFVVARRRDRVHRPPLPCLYTPPADGGGLGASSAPPIQRTRPTPPRCRSKNESPGLRSCGRRDGYPCARERPSLAITRTRDVHEWGSTRSGGRAGMVSFGAISVTSAMVVRVIWRVAGRSVAAKFEYTAYSKLAAAKISNMGNFKFTYSNLHGHFVSGYQIWAAFPSAPVSSILRDHHAP